MISGNGFKKTRLIKLSGKGVTVHSIKFTVYCTKNAMINLFQKYINMYFWNLNFWCDQNLIKLNKGIKGS